jgi:uncharacterized protein (TIGR00255 family)
MIKSMTGYGKAEFEVNRKKITLEIKSLNSKQIDINTRIPVFFREKELEIRKILSEKLIRGKIDLTVYIENLGEESNSKINESILKSYFGQIKKVSDELNLVTDHSSLNAVLKLPDVIKTEYDTLDEEEWKTICSFLDNAIREIDNFRIREGESIASDITENTQKIRELLSKTAPYEDQRINTVKKRLTDNLNKLNINGNIDDVRFEQELIYYLDKIDMNEEKVRLENHCAHFMETIEQEGPNGKKLSFIAQEMGREINTLGSKAYESNIQRIVVMMKDHLERIKEQLLNVL